MVEAESLLELTRYIHLNPLRAGLVRLTRPWQACDEVLRQFAATRGPARQRYRAFVAEGIARGRRPDLQGGGLCRSAGG